MDLIKELANVLEHDKPKSFGLLIPEGSKLKRLYDLVKEACHTEKEIAEELYASTPGDKRYIMLKRNLINKLSELVLIANHSDVNRKNYIKHQFHLEKQLTIARKLLFSNVYHNAERITKKTLKKAQEYHLDEIELSSYQTLRKINYLKGFGDKVEKYNQLLLIKQRDLIDLESVKGLLQGVLSQIKFIRSQTTSVADKCLHAEKITLSSPRLNSSPFLQINLLRLRLIRFHQLNDLKSWKETLNELEDLISKYPYLETEHIILEANISKLKHLIASGSYKKTKQTIKKLLRNTSYKAYNRFEVMAELFQIELNKGSYGKAKNILLEVFQANQFQFLDKQDKSAWILRLAYLKLIYEFDLSEDTFDELLDENNFQKFHSSCAGTARDKTGFNLQFVIIKSIFLLYTEKSDGIGEENNLKVYYQRHLKDRIGVRTQLFYKSFRRVLKYNFRKAVYQEEFTKIEELKNHRTYDYCEVVPYEVLWEKLKIMTK